MGYEFSWGKVNFRKSPVQLKILKEVMARILRNFCKLMLYMEVNLIPELLSREL